MENLTKKVGVWMNHSIAHLMEFSNNPFEIKTIESNFTQEVKKNSLQKGEHHLHNKEKEEQTKYFRKIMKAISKYNEVVLFGPTDAKEELFNVVLSDNRFQNSKILVKQTDKMTPNQRQPFYINSS